MPYSYNNFYSRVYAFQNLLTAFYRARAGKRKRKDVARFEFNLEKNLIELSEELKTQSYHPGEYKNFYVHDQKRRLITAVPFRDRVVHHALLNIIEHIFDRMFIYDSFGCRIGKGQHRAGDRYQQFARNNKYVLRCDIQKFYPSVDHEILLKIIKRWIRDKDVLWLIEVILASGKDVLNDEYILSYFPGDNLFTPFDRRRGLPIGNLTSQFFGNIYLNLLDHFIKEELRCKCYLRYMDDFAIFHDSKTVLRAFHKRIIEYLQKLRLVLNPNRQFIAPTHIGLDFLGYRIFLTHRLVRKQSVYRYSRRLKSLVVAFKTGTISLDELKTSLSAWFGHIKWANAYNLRKVVLERADLLYINRVNH